MHPIQRTFDPGKKRAIPVRLSHLAPSPSAPDWIVSIPPADGEVIELEGAAAESAWSDSVLVYDFTEAFEDSIPMPN